MTSVETAENYESPAEKEVSVASIGTKVDRLIASLKAKNAKLAAENARLKESHKNIKTVNSRIRQIPKKPKEEA